MPWCEGCSRFWTPTSMREDGACPSCGRLLPARAAAVDTEAPRAPWHFKLLVAGVVGYLGWRVLQLLAMAV